MIRTVISALALVLLSSTALGHSTALAATTDQSYTGYAPGTYGGGAWDLFADIDSTWSFSQTYTAGITGTLVQVSVPLTNVSGATPPLQVEIDNSKGVPLDTVTTTPYGLPNWNSDGGNSNNGCAWVLVTVSAPQIAGKHYAIVLSSNSPLTYGWCGTSASGYAGGSTYKSSPPGSNWRRARAVGDLGFITNVG